eukprot:GHUV01001054.1.p1 GENE.GHUV01001054.1~~GHUV01001054.1.p1  ORF type:complete len:111 (+),score=45.88 GHUV01001054.1:535-867(+)
MQGASSNPRTGVASEPAMSSPSKAAAGPQQQQLQEQQQLQTRQQLQEQQQQMPADCLGCRVTGLMLGLGGGGYVSSRLFENPRPRGAHRYTLIGVSVGLFGLGISRALGF